MANGPFDRTIINLRERALSSDINQEASQVDYSLRFALEHMFAKSSGFTSGFVGNSYRVVQNSPVGMSVLVSPGLGFINSPADTPAAIGGVVGLDDLAVVKPLVLNAPQVFVVPPNASGNPRIDIIEVKVDRRADNPSSRLIFDPATEAFVAGSVNKTLAFSHDGRTGTVATPASSTAGLSYKTGTPAGVPVAPPVTAGYLKIAEINVASGAVSITSTELVDRRVIHAPGGVVRANQRSRVVWNAGVPIITSSSDNAPPPVKINLIPNNPGPGRGDAIIIITGGEIAGVTITANLAIAALGATNKIVTPVLQYDVAALIKTVDATIQAMLGAVSVNVGIGSKVVLVQGFARFQSAGTTNNTDVLLEDLEWNVDVSLTY